MNDVDTGVMPKKKSDFARSESRPDKVISPVSYYTLLLTVRGRLISLQVYYYEIMT